MLIAALPPFEGLQLSPIHVLKSKTQVEFATRALMDARLSVLTRRQSLSSQRMPFAMARTSFSLPPGNTPKLFRLAWPARMSC